MSRLLLGVAMVFAGCLSTTTEDSGVNDAGDALDADASVMASGVWFESSTRFELSTTWYFFLDRGYICRTATRDELTPEQLTTLWNVKLVPYVEECVYDFSSFDTLTVFDSDGGIYSIKGTTCGEVGREWMLPSSASSAFSEMGAPCIDPVSFEDGGDPGPGSMVWFDTSVSLKLMRSTYTSYAYPAGTPNLEHTCRAVNRAELTPEQENRLAALTLVPLTFDSDPHEFEDLVVLDADGGEVTYRSNAGSSFHLPNQRARFEPGVYSALADAGTSIDCW